MCENFEVEWIRRRVELIWFIEELAFWGSIENRDRRRLVAGTLWGRIMGMSFTYL